MLGGAEQPVPADPRGAAEAGRGGGGRGHPHCCQRSRPSAGGQQGAPAQESYPHHTLADHGELF
jgi:hypothetical protein